MACSGVAAIGQLTPSQPEAARPQQLQQQQQPQGPSPCGGSCSTATVEPALQGRQPCLSGAGLPAHLQQLGDGKDPYRLLSMLVGRSHVEELRSKAEAAGLRSAPALSFWLKNMAKEGVWRSTEMIVPGGWNGALLRQIIFIYTGVAVSIQQLRPLLADHDILSDKIPPGHILQLAVGGCGGAQGAPLVCWRSQSGASCKAKASDFSELRGAVQDVSPAFTVAIRFSDLTLTNSGWRHVAAAWANQLTEEPLSVTVKYVPAGPQVPAVKANKRTRGDDDLSSGHSSLLYMPSIAASMIAMEPKSWVGMLAAMRDAGQDYLFDAAAADAALWSPPCLQFYDAWRGPGADPPTAAKYLRLATQIRSILLQAYATEDPMQNDILQALSLSGFFPGLVKAQRGREEADLRMEDGALVAVKLGGGAGDERIQNRVYYVRLIADKELLNILQHCCAPILDITIRGTVRFSSCARLAGHATSQELCTWSSDQRPEQLARMLHAASVFCEAARGVWAGARTAAAAALCRQRRGAMTPPRTCWDVTRSSGASPLPGVLPTWLLSYKRATQLGGVGRNVWLLELTGALPTAAASSSSSSGPLPTVLVVKYLVADGEQLELALRSWAVHRGWGKAGLAPPVVGQPWLCAAGRYLGYAMEYLPMQHGEVDECCADGTPKWRLLQHWPSDTAAAAAAAALEAAALKALERAHLVQVEFAACPYTACPPSAVSSRRDAPATWTAVHGDLRQCNVAARRRQGPAGMEVLFLDFGFAGVAPGLDEEQYVARFPPNINTKPRMWARGVEAGGMISTLTDRLQLQGALAGF